MGIGPGGIGKPMFMGKFGLKLQVRSQEAKMRQISGHVRERRGRTWGTRLIERRLRVLRLVERAIRGVVIDIVIL
jgi:hypothetical protein